MRQGGNLRENPDYLRNVTFPDNVESNSFARAYFRRNTPWRGVTGEASTSDDLNENPSVHSIKSCPLWSVVPAPLHLNVVHAAGFDTLRTHAFQERDDCIEAA